MKKIILMLILIINNLSYSKDVDYSGYYKMKNNKFVIKIEEDKINKDKYKGYVYWLKDPVYKKGDKMQGQVQIDRNNKNKRLRNRRVLGLQVVGDLVLNKKNNKLENGWIYDSWNGKMYHGTARLKNEETLLLKGSFDKFGIIGYTMKAKKLTKKELENL